MNAEQCLPVSGWSDRRAFLNLEKRLYADDPNWVTPLWSERKALCGFTSHPFYNDAESQAFLVRRHGQVVGRVLAIVNHAHNRHHNEKRGFFGFFESIDDVDVARCLMDRAGDWLREKGMTDVRGPVHPSLNYEVGLLIDGFDTPPTFLIPYNHAYYAQLIEACGFKKSQDLFCYEAGIEDLDDLDPKLQFVIEEATKRFKVKTRPIDRSHFEEDVQVFLSIYNQSLQRTWGYVPMSNEELVHQAKQLKWLIVPELTSIAEIDGKPVGAGFGLLDYNQILKNMNGHLLPLGWWKLLNGKRKIDRLRLVSTNVLPEYQKWGLGLVTLSRVLPDAIDFGIQVGEFSWVLESNSLSRGTIERGGAKKVKTQRIYDRPL
ncbi:N-acetyltransferase [Roseiconus nitratireducens]|uniref:N-acetyltransferase n=1 Tax=Roseiconus nitratireducens TaxID=2605748 RepID=A0A5M6DDD3_9BACT|nr:N-acetyltransferase [Roseiconus nitratireducens]KAA5545581.1 N-acetyltransferase [Roseiconus nitratireducens]